MNCEKIINETLSVLDTPPERVQDFMAADQACIARLVSLNAECSASMIRIAHEMLQHAHQDCNEYKLQVLLRSLIQRKHPQTLDLVIEAFRSLHTSDKELYVTLLQDFDDPRVAATLIDFVATTSSMDVDDDQIGVLAKAIDLLRHARVERAAPTLLLRLNDHAERVRAAVIDFLVELGIKSAAASFMLQLEQETDPDNLRALVNALAGWNYVDALPPLRRILEGDMSNDNELVHKSIDEAINTITELMDTQNTHHS